MALHGDVWGKKVTKGRKLRIHSIIDKAALKFDSEACVLKKRDGQRLKASQITF
jgi:hypothetical protein